MWRRLYVGHVAMAIVSINSKLLTRNTYNHCSSQRSFIWSVTIQCECTGCRARTATEFWATTVLLVWMSKFSDQKQFTFNFTSLIYIHTEVCLSHSFISHEMVFVSTIQYTQESVAVFIIKLKRIWSRGQSLPAVLQNDLNNCFWCLSIFTSMRPVQDANVLWVLLCH